jgi:hypothetical protein
MRVILQEGIVADCPAGGGPSQRGERARQVRAFRTKRVTTKVSDAHRILSEAYSAIVALLFSKAPVVESPLPKARERALMEIENRWRPSSRRLPLRHEPRRSAARPSWPRRWLLRCWLSEEYSSSLPSSKTTATDGRRADRRPESGPLSSSLCRQDPRLKLTPWLIKPRLPRRNRREGLAMASNPVLIVLVKDDDFPPETRDNPEISS